MARLGRALTTLTATAITAVSAFALATFPARAGTVQDNATQAVVTASAAGYRTSIAVFDTQTGQAWGAGDYASTYPSESVVKVFIAARLLLEGQMSGWTESTAWLMITRSDDAAANALYGRAGGDGVINWIKQHYDVPILGSPPPRAGWWGGTRITAAGIVQLYNKIRHDPAVWPWLGAAMHATTEYGSDGTWQFFGIPSATQNAAVKQGWGADGGDGRPSFNSTGLVNGDRFAVAILTQGPGYGKPISDMLTREAQLLMPGGSIIPPPVSPIGTVDAVTVDNNRVRITGWAFDPDQSATSIQVAVYDNDRGIAWFPTGGARPDVNAVYGIGGAHGFTIELEMAAGQHRLCVFGINVGPASPNPLLGCQTATVTVSLSRAAVMGMLYQRAHPGSTAPACRTAPFSDVAVSSKDCGVIAWAATAGITTGFADGSFHPAAPVTRQDAAAFLYRLSTGQKTLPSCSTSPFPDVAPNNPFCGAITWLANRKITTGYSDGGYRPTGWVDQYAMSTFLRRLGAPAATLTDKEQEASTPSEAADPAMPNPTANPTPAASTSAPAPTSTPDEAGPTAAPDPAAKSTPASAPAPTVSSTALARP